VMKDRGWHDVVMVVKVMRPGLSAADDASFADWLSPGWRDDVNRMSGDGTRVSLSGFLELILSFSLCLDQFATSHSFFVTSFSL
jgi:hypothetical protein